MYRSSVNGRPFAVMVFLSLSSTPLLAAMPKSANRATAAEPAAPFCLPWEAPDDAIADASFLLDPPAGKHGPVVVRDGHFAFADGGRVRFWGINLSGEACFPPKDVAPRLADRLAKYGFNLVRFHHMDSGTRNRIFDEEYADTRHFSAERVDRLDFLIAELKKRGMYVNLNLHVGRRFREADGVAQADWLAYGKYCTIFDPRMIELQKEYARMLLAHRNPYTDKTYADDPAVVIVELTNENSLFGGWTSGRLRGEQRSRPRGGWTDIPPFYGEELTRFFNEWLVRQYGSREALAKAWGVGARPAGPAMLVNGDFADGRKGWDLGAFQSAEAKLDIVREDGRSCAKVTVAKVTDTRWHVMLTQRPVKVADDEQYAVHIRAKASSPRRISVEVCHAGPYRGYGHAAFEATTGWSEHEFAFTAPADDDNVRLSIQLGEATGTVWIADVRMHTTAIDGLRPGEDPARGTVRRLVPEEFDAVSDARFRDEGRFYYDTELGYYKEMYKFLKDELDVGALIQGTNHNYGLPCLWAESQLDHMDCHAYWQHPRFPNRPWSRTDWTIGNSAMLDEPQRSTIAGLCRSSVAGKPFTVSEYNHPFPNEYGCEMPLLLAAYGCLQDWDAIYPYTFCHKLREEELSGNEVTGYFDICNEVSKLAQMPAAALAFLRGDVHPAERLVAVEYSENHLFDSLRGPRWRRGFELVGELSPLLPLVHRFRVARFDGDRTTRADAIPFEEPREQIASDTGEVVWHTPDNGKNYLTIDTPRLAAAVGWIGGRTIETASVRFHVKTPFCAVSAISLDEKPLRESATILVLATARCANTGMKWNDERNSIHDRWGGPPLLIEPVVGRLVLHGRTRAPGALRAMPLNGRGLALGESKPLASADRGAVLILSDQPPTVWYAVTAK